MTSVMETHRLALPLIQPGQAQKEMTHNEALLLLDLLVQSVVESVTSVVPTTPSQGTCWIVGPGATGAWSGKADALALWSSAGWRFVAAREGMRVWLRTAGLEARFDGTQWRMGEATAGSLSIGGIQVVGQQRPAISAPAAGSTVDIEARATIDQILVALRGHGLIGTG